MIEDRWPAFGITTRGHLAYRLMIGNHPGTTLLTLGNRNGLAGDLDLVPFFRIDLITQARDLAINHDATLLDQPLDFTPRPITCLGQYFLYSFTHSINAISRVSFLPVFSSGFIIMASREFISLSIAVLTISDTRTLEEDTSGQVLEDRLKEAGHQLADRQIAPDDIYQIPVSYTHLTLPTN